MMSEAPTQFQVGSLEDKAAEALIAQFVALWSLAESTLMMPFIRATAATQEVAASVLAGVNSAEGKIRVVRSVVANSRLPTAEQEQINAALKSFLKLCERRNAVAHHLWATGNDGKAYTIDHRKPAGTEGRIRQWSRRDLADLCNRTLRAAHEICKASGSSWVSEEVVRLRTL